MRLPPWPTRPIMVLARSLALLVCLASVAHAAPCKDTASCTTACDGGDPSACVLALETKFRPLAADKLTANDKKETTCSESLTIRCSRFGACGPASA